MVAQWAHLSCVASALAHSPGVTGGDPQEPSDDCGGCTGVTD